MAYATIGDVQARMPQFTLTPTSKPTIADAETFIGDVEAEIDAALTNLGYILPGTGPIGLTIVKAWSAQGTIARVLTARAAAVGGDAAIVSAQNAQKLFDAKFLALADPKNPLELIDWARNGDEVSKPGSDLDGPTETGIDGSCFEPRVTMDMKF